MLENSCSQPLADLKSSAEDSSYCGPKPRAPRTHSGILLVQVVLGLLAHTCATCTFAEADNIYKQSSPVANVRTPASPAFPLKASANNRYLVDQNNVPFLMVGDSPQALIGNLSPMEAAFFMAN